MNQAPKTVLTIVIIGSSLFGQSTASGVLTLNQQTFQLGYSAAIQVPDSLDKGKMATRIVVADKPIPPEVMDDEASIWDLKSKDFHGIQIDIGAGKGSINTFIISNTLEGSMSGSRTFDFGTFPVFTNKRVEGTIKNEGEIGSNKYSYDVKFATDIVASAPEPSADDASAAAHKESTKAYLALVEAIRSGNKQQILAMSPPERRAMIDTPDFPKMLQLVQAMQPQNIRVLKATETGDTAILIVSGRQEGANQRGKITLIKANGKWVMAEESWKAK